jgi:hypothetical protein
MNTAMNVSVGAVAAVAGLVGLFLAAGSVDFGMEFFGLSLFLFGTGLIFWLIKMHFDYVDKSR